MRSAKVFTIGLVSPGDVAEERKLVEATIHRLRVPAAKRGMSLEIRKWEDVRGGYYPQGVQTRIQQELGIEHCDLLIALFWKRYGAIDKPPYSRTATEVVTAMAAKQTRGEPEIIAYFSLEPYSPRSKDELEEHGRVLEFKAELQRAEVLTKDFLRTDLSLMVDYDIRDILDEIFFADRAHDDLRAQISCIPSRARREGYTELIGDIQVALTGTLPGSKRDESMWMDIKVTLSANVTNRIAEHGIFEHVLLVSERGILANGRRGSVANAGVEHNVVSFSAIPLESSRTAINEILTIKGIRVDAESMGISAVFAQQEISAGVEITWSPQTTPMRAVVRKFFPVAILCRPLFFSIETQFLGNFMVPAGEEGSLHVFFLRVGGNLAETLRTHAENGQTPEAEYGTVLALDLANLPEGATVFASVSNVQERRANNLSDQTVHAIGVRTTSNGVPIGPIDIIVGLGFPDLPMFRIYDQLAAWEFIRPIQNESSELVFALAVLVPHGCPPWESMAMVGLAPFFSTAAARSASRTLPIPRFTSAPFPLTLPLGKSR